MQKPDELEKWVTSFFHITLEEWRAMSGDEAVRLLMGEDDS